MNYPATQKQAIESYRRALRWLPPDHPYYAEALKQTGGR